MSTLEKFREIAAEPFNPSLREHKEGGGRIIGAFCSYVPEEIIIAAGMVPFRMRATGSTKTALGDTWFSSINCTYVRHLMDLAMEGKFGFIDGIVFANSCDHIRRLWDNWKRGVGKPEFNHMLAVPHKREGDALGWFREELGMLKKAIEDHYGVEITDQALRDAISASNQVRALLERLYDLRKQDEPPISGAETLAVMMAGTSMPRDQFAHMLDQLLEELPGRKAYPGKVSRVMMASGCLEEIEHLETIEAQGAAVVDDSLCLGRRYFDTKVEEGEDDPLMAIAKRYMFHLSCPRIPDDFKRRLEHMHNSAREYRLDGVITEKLKFCDLWGGEAFILRQESKKTGLPVLAIERELYGGGEGQVKTRVQAFLERISRA